MRETDCFSTKDTLRLIQSIPSPKAEPFKMWLAQVGTERVDEIADPEKAVFFVRKTQEQNWSRAVLLNFIDTDLFERAGDNPTIGLLICKSKDDVYAQYSIEGYNQPLGISGFEGVNILPDGYKHSLPSIEDIENELKLK